MTAWPYSCRVRVEAGWLRLRKYALKILFFGIHFTPMLLMSTGLGLGLLPSEHFLADMCVNECIGTCL
jgi:hypothetical protein